MTGYTGYTGAPGLGAKPPLAVFALGVLAGLQTLLLYAFANTFSMPANMVGSVALAQAAATASAVLTFYQNGNQFGTCTFPAGGTVGTFSSSAVNFNPNDVLMVLGPATADATLANLMLTLVGV
jgi:hypothetical protein